MIYKEYKTTDIVLAACLRLENVVLTDIEIEGTKGTFCFADVSDTFITEYDLGHLQVEPVTFNNAIKQLTTTIRRKIRA